MTECVAAIRPISGTPTHEGLFAVVVGVDDAADQAAVVVSFSGRQEMRRLDHKYSTTLKAVQGAEYLLYSR